MKLVIKKKDVLYGVNGADAAITDIANIETLKEGSFLCAFDNGVVILADGTFVGDASEKAIIYHMRQGELEVTSPIFVGKSRLLPPLADHAAAPRRVTFSIVIPGTITEEGYTGLSFIDQSKNEPDPTRRKDVSVYTNPDSTQTTLDALQAKVLALDFVATCTLAANTLTITYVAGANIHVSGLGEFETRVATETQALSQGDSLSPLQMAEFVHSISPFDGNRDASIDGIIGTWVREYGVEDYNYLNFGIVINTDMYSTGKPDMDQYGGVLYVAFPEGDLAAAANEGFVDIFNAMISGVSNDSGGAGADAADN